MKKTAMFVLALLVLSLTILPINFAVTKRNAFESQTQTGGTRASLNLEGGAIEDIVIAPNGTVYAAANSANGIFSLKSGSSTWQGPSATSDLGSPIDVEVDSSSNAYMISGIDLYKSTNNGASWTKLTTGRGDYDQTLLYAQGKLLAPSRNGSVDISSNGGTSFTNAAVASSQRIVSLASSTAGVFFALVGEGANATLYKSVDGGANWNSTGKTGNYTVVGANSNGTVVLAGPPGAEYSTDNSSNWNSMGNPNGQGHITFSGNRVYIGNSWTDNNGASWHNMQSEATSYTSILKGDSFAVNPGNSNQMYIRSGRGIARTTDGGATWADLFDGMNGIIVNDIAQAANKNVVWVAAHGGLAKTTNFNSTTPSWNFPILPSPAVDYATAVWVNSDNPNIVLAGAGTLLYRSIDGGTSWTDTGAPLAGGTSVTDFVAVNNNTIYAAYGSNSTGGLAGGGVLASTNGGVSWSAASGLPNISVNALAVGPDNSIYAGIGSENNTSSLARGIYKYNGTSWSQLSGAISGFLINDLLFVGNTLYAAGGETNQGGVFKSTNAGQTWTELKGGLPTDGWFKALASETGVNSTIYAATGRPAGTSYIYKSMDGGQSWGKFYTGLIDEAFNTLLFDGLVGGSDTGLYSYKSKASLALKAKRTKNNRYKLIVTLKDAATKKVLKKRLVKLYKRVIVNKKIKKKLRRVAKWRLVSKKKMNNRGQAAFIVRKGKTIYQVRWSPTSKRDKVNYNSSKSKNIKA